VTDIRIPQKKQQKSRVKLQTQQTTPCTELLAIC